MPIECRGEDLARSIEQVADMAPRHFEHWEYISHVLRTYAAKIREHPEPDGIRAADFFRAVNILRVELQVALAYVEAGCAPPGPRRPRGGSRD